MATNNSCNACATRYRNCVTKVKCKPQRFLIKLSAVHGLGRHDEQGLHLIFKFRELDGKKFLYEENQRLYFKNQLPFSPRFGKLGY